MRAELPVAAELSWTDVNAWRLARHHLDERAPRTKLAAVVGDIGAVQAQVMSAAELQIVVRCDCTVHDVRDALWKRRTLVKTWLMRGTLHLARADDLPMFTGATSWRWVKPSLAWQRYFGVDDAELRVIAAAIGDALDGTPRSREELIATVGKGRSDKIHEALRSGWGGMLKPAARNGMLCFGPNRGQSVTFVSPREWLGRWRQEDPDDALVDVARRYLHAYGPATKHDFSYWWGHWTGVDAAAWSGLGGELVSVSVEGWRAWMLGGDLKRMEATKRGPRVRLLPNFDPFLMGHGNRDHLFERVHRPKVSRTAGWISPVVLVEGRVAGVWAYTVAKDRLRVEITPFAQLGRGVLGEARTRAEEIAHALGTRLEKVSVA